MILGVRQPASPVNQGAPGLVRNPVSKRRMRMMGQGQGGGGGRRQRAIDGVRQLIHTYTTHTKIKAKQTASEER